MSTNLYKQKNKENPQIDVAIVGAGFSGLYLLHLLRSKGFSAKIFEAENDIGGTWFLNRYPGARCDVPTSDYSYSFDPDLEKEWTWSERFATQTEILSYLHYVADKYKLRKDIQLTTRVMSAHWNENTSLWNIVLNKNDDESKEIHCRFLIMASGCLSIPKEIDIPGINKFAKESYRTSNWPQHEVSFKGKRVAVIGTGSSGIQIIPPIATDAESVVVFQRTPCFSLPINNRPITSEEREQLRNTHKEYREAAKMSAIGVNVEINNQSALLATEEERNERYEHLWKNSGIAEAASAFNDLGTNAAANETLAEFIRNKIRNIVNNSKTAEILCPKDFAVFTKRLCFDNNYYQTFNLPHVRLVDLTQDPITSITERGLDTKTESFEFDILVYALGFNAITGALLAIDIIGRDSISLRDKWSTGPSSYLGLMTAGFPNLFTVTGPGSPSVTTNMLMSIEQHVEWIADCIQHLAAHRIEVIEPSEAAEKSWTQYVNDWADLTLFPKAKSWYTGANITGKPQGFMPFIGGLGNYTQICNEVVNHNYMGFSLKGNGISRYNDDIICPLKPDVATTLGSYNQIVDMPRPETLSAQDARVLYATFSTELPLGSFPGEIINDVLPGADIDLAYRLYRPKSSGPHSVVIYFHGGGWVLGNLNSDDSFCRDLCIKADVIVLSLNYRLAPEFPFPTALNDAYTALKWVVKNTDKLNALPGKIAVAGWSAGANIATVLCHMARDLGDSSICGQLLINPMTDCDFSRASYLNYGEDYVLTASLIRWFWDHYIDINDRENPKAAPIRSKDLSNLPPTFIATSEFDPLRDEGQAYALALQNSDVKVTSILYRGHIHSSLIAADSIRSSEVARSDMAAALTEFFNTSWKLASKAITADHYENQETLEMLEESV